MCREAGEGEKNKRGSLRRIIPHRQRTTDVKTRREKKADKEIERDSTR